MTSPKPILNTNYPVYGSADTGRDVSNFKLPARTFPKAGHNFTLNPSRENYPWLNILLAVSPILSLSQRIRNEKLTIDRERERAKK